MLSVGGLWLFQPVKNITGVVQYVNGSKATDTTVVEGFDLHLWNF